MDRTVPAGAALLLDFVRRTEVGRDDRASYDVIYANKQGKLAKPLTSMTIDEVLAAQRGWSKNHGSSAAGGYQFMRNTLIDLKEELGLRGSQKLDPDLQDRLGYHLLKRRGYEGFMAGTISRTEFGKRLAMEWASFPVLAGTKGQKRQVKRGQSFYAGDGINKALVAPDVVEGVLDRVKAAGNATPEPQSPPAEPAPQTPDRKPEPVAKSKRFWTWFGTAFAGGGGLSLSAFGALDWKVQMFLAVVVTGFAVYAITSMPAVRDALGFGK